MTSKPSFPIPANVAVTLNAVLAAIDHERPLVLCVGTENSALGLPYGPFDPERHRTFEIGMREWVERQTEISPGYIEQLYTFGDKGRELPAAALAGNGDTDRVVSVGYLALAPEPAQVIAEDAQWQDWYAFFPWEDWRHGQPKILASHIIKELNGWAKAADKLERSLRINRINVAFGQGGFGWEEERTLDRYELMYEAGLVEEANRDREPPPTGNSNSRITGLPMLSDHRRILATAIGRLRGKLKYRPVIFEMTPSSFTLLQLQKMIEAIVGFEFHKQNFRRSVEKSGFVKPTGEFRQQPSGRPAALFCVDRSGLRDKAASGLALPRLRRG